MAVVKEGEFSSGMNLIPITAKLYHICIKCLDICNTVYKKLKMKGLSKLFVAVFFGGTTVGLLKAPGKVGGVIKAHLISNIGDIRTARL